MIKTLALYLIIISIIFCGFEMKRQADAQNYANQIMVGLQNGVEPAPGNFKKADPPKNF